MRDTCSAHFIALGVNGVIISGEKVEVRKLLIITFSPISYYFIPLWEECSLNTKISRSLSLL
jgi:hypothetical protein